jgi:hypothetical protein
MNQHIKRIKLQMCVRTTVLQSVERDPAALIDSNNFAVDKRIQWKILTSVGDLREPRREQISAAGPEDNSAGTLSSKAAIAIELGS